MQIITSDINLVKSLFKKSYNESKMQENCPICKIGKVYGYYRRGMKVWTSCDICHNASSYRKSIKIK